MVVRMLYSDRTTELTFLHLCLWLLGQLLMALVEKEARIQTLTQRNKELMHQNAAMLPDYAKLDARLEEKVSHCPRNCADIVKIEPLRLPCVCLALVCLRSFVSTRASTSASCSKPT
jgi:hypothetical protein